MERAARRAGGVVRGGGARRSRFIHARAPLRARISNHTAMLACGLSLSDVEDIRADAFADDVEIDMQRMHHWTPSEVEGFFLSGGTVAPQQWLRRPPATLPPPPAAEPEASNPMWCCSGAWTAYAAQNSQLLPRETAPLHAPISKAAAPSKPRLLCLHGSQSNPETTGFQVEILGLHDPVPTDARCDCTLLEAPHAGGTSSLDSFGSSVKSWHIAGVADSLEVSLRTVVEHVESSGPYDGAYGFSQGAGILTLLSHQAVWTASGGSAASFPPWRFVIIGCGHDGLLANRFPSPTQPPKLSLPSVHIIGAKDPFAPNSRALAELYVDAKLLEHEEGHTIPLSAIDGDLAATVNRFVDTHCT